jgi:hypothetical protein
LKGCGVGESQGAGGSLLSLVTTTSRVYGEYAVFVESKALKGAASRNRAAGTRARRFAPGESTSAGTLASLPSCTSGDCRTQDVLSPPLQIPIPVVALSQGGCQLRHPATISHPGEGHRLCRTREPSEPAQGELRWDLRPDRSRRVEKGIGSPSARPPRARSVKRNIGLSPVFKSHQIETASLL